MNEIRVGGLFKKLVDTLSRQSTKKGYSTSNICEVPFRMEHLHSFSQCTRSGKEQRRILPPQRDIRIKDQAKVNIRRLNLVASCKALDSECKLDNTSLLRQLVCFLRTPPC